MRQAESAVGSVPAREQAAAVCGAAPSSFPPARACTCGLLAAMLATGCAEIRPYVPPSEGHIAAPAVKPAPPQEIPPPARVSTFVPPPRPAVKPQTYSVVVNEVPVKELLLALARDTKQNIDIHSGLTGLVSMNAINETLPAILDRISKQVNLRYRVEGNTIIVSPDTPHMRTYRVNYVNTSRNISSTINVTGEISSSVVSGSGGTSGGASSQSSAGGSKTEVTSKSNNDFWEQLRDNIHAILISTRRIAATAEEKAERTQQERVARDDALKAIEAASRAGAGASELVRSTLQSPPRPAPTLPQTDVGKDVIVNPISGTVTVLATEKQHQLIQQHLDSIVSAAQRQVLIEATIVEVLLSNNYQGGIDWGRISTSGGIAFTQALIGNNLATAPFFALMYNQANQRPGDLNLTLKLLQEFGNTRVISSPKLMALNNQTALLKVVDNLVYFEVQTQPAVIGTTGIITPPTVNTTAKSVSVGLVMGVTPQINEDGRVTLIVRPTISRTVGDGKRDPNPSLTIPNIVPEIQVREMESVLQVGSGQTVILGGLMEDTTRFDRQQVPGADQVSGGASIGGLGELFRFRTEEARKTELIIFLRPTVVNNPTLDSDELRFFQRFLPQPEPPPERTGATR